MAAPRPSEPANTAISEQRRGKLPLGCLVGFLSIFVIVGLGFTYMMFVEPVARLLGARSWLQTPCEILSSEVEEHPGDDGSTYSVNVAYEYEVGWQRYVGRRYDFFAGASSGVAGKQAVVDRLPPGTRTFCFVDPDDPREAVLDRSFGPRYLIGLIPMVFVLAGGGAMWFAVRSARTEPRRSGGVSALAREAPRTKPDPARFPSAASGSVTLSPQASPLGKLVGVTFACLFWNGITGVFVGIVVKEWINGEMPIFLSLFLLPLVLIGLALLASVPYQFLALFNPRPTLVLSSPSVALGSSIGLEWRFSGAAGRIRRLLIVLEGRESATYRRGTSSTTDTRVFTRATLADSDSGAGIASGYTRIDVPANTMHTFEASHNSVRWFIKVTGDIARWPDVDAEFELAVRAMAPGEWTT